jgi:hypothetical protein
MGQLVPLYGSVVTFRHDQNAARFAEGAGRMSMPAVPASIFVNAVRGLYKLRKIQLIRAAFCPRGLASRPVHSRCVLSTWVRILAETLRKHLVPTLEPAMCLFHDRWKLKCDILVS